MLALWRHRMRDGMDLKSILKSLENCPCGREHTFDTERVEIGRGLVGKVGQILSESSFPKKVLLVADSKTLRASTGILESLETAGFWVKKRIYDCMEYARVEQVLEIEADASDCDGILSVGTGSLNDICRVASYRTEKDFCIFATAPSMDGFASDTAPIIENSFKSSWQAKQPRVIIADTEILAAAPDELKSAGFGDMMAKYIGLVDWKIAQLLINEYYCDRVAAFTEEAVRRIVALADRILDKDPEAAGAVMEALVLTGLAMKLAHCSRPASGSEHVVSHYWECHKVIAGIWPEYHGKKVGVATVICNRIYRNIAERHRTVTAVKDATDWTAVYAKFHERLHEDVKRLNMPTITELVSPEDLEQNWDKIRTIILETLPDDETLVGLMKSAGAVTEPEDVHISEEFLLDGLRYSAYMRYRLTLLRLLPMLGMDPADYM